MTGKSAMGGGYQLLQFKAELHIDSFFHLPNSTLLISAILVFSRALDAVVNWSAVALLCFPSIVTRASLG